MDPTLTRSQAHKVFGELYRKSRPPELQEKIDRVVSTTSDIFVRIKRIEELDEAYEKSQRASSRPARSGGGSGGGKPAARSRGGGGLPPAGSPRTASSVMAPRPSGKKKESNSGFLNFFRKLFGGDVAVWGRKTGTLESGMMGINLELSRDVIDIFRGITDNQLASSIKCFKSVMKFGWERWSPQKYNTVVTAYQFLTEFAKVPSVFTQRETPMILVNNTLKMQKFYGMLLKYPDYKTVIRKDLVDLAARSDELTEHVQGLRTTMDYIINLESRNPNLINAILAFYALNSRRVYSWDDICKQLDIREPVLNQYRAPESVQAVINGRIKKMKQGIVTKQGEIKEIEEIRKRYFNFSSSGKLNIDFLRPVAEDVVHRTVQEKMVNDTMVKSYMTVPHKLLFAILRDFDISAIPLMGGPVTFQGVGGTEDIVIFKPGLFRAATEELDGCLRAIDNFIKKNNDFNYTFKQFKEDAASKESSDTNRVALLQIVTKSNRVLRHFAMHLKTIVDNHRMAVAHDRAGNNKEKLARTREVPIESLDIGMRFIPHDDRILFNSSRYNGLTIVDALEEILKILYNALYIFRDTEVIKTMSATAKIQAEISTMETELKRLGVLS